MKNTKTKAQINNTCYCSRSATCRNCSYDVQVEELLKIRTELSFFKGLKDISLDGNILTFYITHERSTLTGCLIKSLKDLGYDLIGVSLKSRHVTFLKYSEAEE